MRIAPPLPQLPLSPVVPQGRAVSSSGSAQQASADHGAADVLALSPGMIRFGGASQPTQSAQPINIDAVDAEGHTALTRAAVHGDLKAAESLLRQGANIEAPGPYGRTALIIAAEKDHPEILTFLIKKEANIDAVDADGHTALTSAVVHRDLKTAKSLLRQGANIEAPGPNGRTALIIAAEKNYPELVTFLLNKEANIEAKDKIGDTALMLASSLTSACLLVGRGADPHVQNINGWTPRTLANHQGHHDIAAMLEQAEAAWDARHGNRPASTGTTEAQAPQPKTTQPQTVCQPEQVSIVNKGASSTTGKGVKQTLITEYFNQRNKETIHHPNFQEHSAQNSGVTYPQPQEEPEPIHYVNLFPLSAPPMPDDMSMPSTPKSQEAGSSNPFQTVFDQDKKEKDKHIQEKAQQVLTQFDRKEPLKKADIDAMGLLNEQTIQEVSQNLRDDLTRAPQKIIDGLKHQYSNALPGSPDSDPMACIFWNVLSQQLFGKIVSDL